MKNGIKIGRSPPKSRKSKKQNTFVVIPHTKINSGTQASYDGLSENGTLMNDHYFDA